MSNMSILTINGRTIDSLGLQLLNSGNVWGAPETVRDASQLIGRVGATASRSSTTAPRTLTVGLALPQSPSSRRAALDRVLMALDGLCELSWSDSPERVQYATVQAAEITARFESVAWTLGHLTLPIVFRIDSPVWFDREVSTVGFAANTPTAIPVGTMPTSPLIVLNDTANAAITITYRGITGATLSSLVVSNPSLSAGQMLLIDCGTERIFKSAGETLTVADNLYSSGSFPVIDPGDGDWINNQYPTLACNFAAFVQYRRVWA